MKKNWKKPLKKKRCNEVQVYTKPKKEKETYAQSIQVLKPGDKAVSYRSQLERALTVVGQRHNKHLIEHAVERSYDSDPALVGLMKKFLPDLKQEDLTINFDGTLKLAELTNEALQNEIDKTSNVITGATKKGEGGISLSTKKGTGVKDR